MLSKFLSVLFLGCVLANSTFGTEDEWDRTESENHPQVKSLMEDFWFDEGGDLQGAIVMRSPIKPDFSKDPELVADEPLLAEAHYGPETTGKVFHVRLKGLQADHPYTMKVPLRNGKHGYFGFQTTKPQSNRFTVMGAKDSYGEWEEGKVCKGESSIPLKKSIITIESMKPVNQISIKSGLNNANIRKKGNRQVWEIQIDNPKPNSFVNGQISVDGEDYQVWYRTGEAEKTIKDQCEDQIDRDLEAVIY